MAAPALAPAEVNVDPVLMEQYAKELAQVSAASYTFYCLTTNTLQAEAVPLPEEDDDL